MKFHRHRYYVGAGSFCQKLCWVQEIPRMSFLFRIKCLLKLGRDIRKKNNWKLQSPAVTTAVFALGASPPRSFSIPFLLMQQMIIFANWGFACICIQYVNNGPLSAEPNPLHSL